MAARRPFWKWHRWKSIGFCLWPPLTCIWNLKLKFQSKLDLYSGNHVVYRQTDGQTDRRTRWIQYTPSNFVGWGYNKIFIHGKQCFITILTYYVMFWTHEPDGNNHWSLISPLSPTAAFSFLVLRRHHRMTCGANVRREITVIYNYKTGMSV